ncbi:MAG: glycosyltransferase [Candidatus Gracilibacteria bacterium]
MKKYKYSIIIPHINEGYLLDITLDSIYSKFKYDKFEIIVVDDGSNNKIDLDFVKNHPLKKKIKIFFQKDLGSPNARNFGAKNSTGDILIFLDSHMYFIDDFLKKINKLLSKYDKIDLLQPIIGSIQDKRMEGCIYKIKDNLLYSHWDLPKIDGVNIKIEDIKDIIETPNIAGGATIIKRKVFEDLDGFNKNFIKWGCEDLEFSMRAHLRGYNCFFTPNLFVAHYFKQSFTNTTVKTEEVLNNRLMTLYTCFNNKARFDLILNDLSNHYGKELFDKINNEVKNNVEYVKWNENQQTNFKYNDDWYFEKFKDYYLDFIKIKNEEL